MSRYSSEDLIPKGNPALSMDTSSTTLLQQGQLVQRCTFFLSYRSKFSNLIVPLQEIEGAENEYRIKKRTIMNELLFDKKAKSTRKELSAAIAVSLTVLVCFLTFILIYMYLSSKSVSTEPAGSDDRTGECGKSPNEAISHGCTFDQLSMLWLPPEASRLGTAQFRERGGPDSWQYWSDGAGQHKITNISMHTGLYWTTLREHLAHCAFHFLRVSDALRGKVLYDFKTYNQEHNRHCALMLLNASMQAPADDLDFIGTTSYISYGSTLPEEQ